MPSAKFFDFSGGYVSRRENPLDSRPNTITGGENVVLEGKYVATRKGYTVTSDGSLPDGEVETLFNVRFPTNEVSYLVAQLKTDPTTWSTPPTPASGWVEKAEGHHRGAIKTVWDTVNQRMYVIGGDTYRPPNAAAGIPNISYYDPLIDVWIDPGPTSGPDASLHYYCACYDSTEYRILVFGGETGADGSNVWMGDLWSYDIDANTWTELTYTGTEPGDHFIGGEALYNPNDHTMIVVGGHHFGSATHTLNPYYVLDLSTLVWSEVTAAGGATVTSCFPGGSFITADNCVWVFNESNTAGQKIWKLDRTTNTWSQPTALTTYGPGGVYNFAGDHGGKLWYFQGYLFAIMHDTTVVSDLDIMLIYNVSTGAITYHTLTYTGLVPNSGSGFIITNYGRFVAHGGWTNATPGVVHGETYILDAYLSGYDESGLFASDDHLPTTTATFERIYTLDSGAGPLSADVLNDRAVLTEGIAEVPLVWGGCQTDDASDWMVPKAVLARQDGVFAYDVTSEVCDSDPDTSADVGSIQASGDLLICCDMPRVSDFYVEMETANAGLTGDASTFTQTLSFSERDDIGQMDVKDTITHWHQTAGATGYFHNAAHSAVTITSGGTANHVGLGSMVIFADGTEVTIIAITHLGEGAGETTLSATIADATVVSYIYNLDWKTGSITPNYNTAGFSTSWGSGYSPSSYSALPMKSVRQVISAADATVSGDRVRVTFKGASKYGIKIDYASIGVQSGGASDTTATPTQLTFNDGDAGASAYGNVDVRDGEILYWRQDANYSGHFEGANQIFSSSAAVTNDGAGLIGFPVVAHEMVAGDYIRIYGTTNYNKTYVLHANTSTTKLVVTETYVAETLTDTAGYRKRPTLGTGANCPNVTAGATVVFATGTLTIETITSNGEQDGEVTLYRNATTDTFPASTYPATTDVQYIYGTVYEIVTDEINFGFDIAAAHVISADYSEFSYTGTQPGSGDSGLSWTSTTTTTATVTTTTFNTNVPVRGAYGTSIAYTKAWDGTEANATYDQSAVTGFTAGTAGYAIGVTQVDVVSVSSAFQSLVVGWTTDDTRLDLSTAEEFYTVDVSCWDSVTTPIYHAVSWDGRQSWYAWISGAWAGIVRNNAGTTWQYRDAFAAWQAAATNDMGHALLSAFGVGTNQMTTTEIEALTSAQWSSAGGFVAGETATMDFAFGIDAGAAGTPSVYSYAVSYRDTGTAGIEGWQNGDWSAGVGWTDGTITGGTIPLGQTGIISYDGPYFEADYTTISDVPGYWYRIKANGTSAGTRITRILYKAPCQPLANIGYGQPDWATRVLFHDRSTGVIKDYSIEMADNLLTDQSTGAIPLTAGDHLYIGFNNLFFGIDLSIWVANRTMATLTAQYWNGGEWVTLNITDNTIFGGATLAQKGKITWEIPTTWRRCIPFETSLDRLYWIRLFPSATLSTSTALSELRVYPQPDALIKHTYAAVNRNRMCLAKSTAMPDVVRGSRELEEYAFNGYSSGIWRVGGGDSIQAMISMWNLLMVAKASSWHIQGESGNFSPAEGLGFTPVNNRVLVKAPLLGQDGMKAGLYLINHHGAYCLTGIQADANYASFRAVCISDNVSWFDESETEHLDMDYLHNSCGVYWPEKNWICWLVPLVVSGSTQTTLNRLLVFDLTLGAWYRPFNYGLDLASLCVANLYNSTAPGHLGQFGLFAGTYDGRIIQLEDGTTDNGAEIAWSVDTAHFGLDTPEYEKEIRAIRLFGTAGTGGVTFEVLQDGRTTVQSGDSYTYTDLTGLVGKNWDIEKGKNYYFGHIYKFRLSGTGQAKIYGVQAEVNLLEGEGQ